MRECHYAWFFETLANPLRMEILLYLLDKPRSVNDIVARTGEEQSNVSHALSILRLCRLVQLKVEGRKHLYQTNGALFRPLLKLVDEQVCANCGDVCPQEKRKKKLKRKQ